MPEYTCEILTPYRRLYSGKVESVVFTTHDGEVEVLAGHEPMVMPVAVGAIRLKGEGLDRVAAVTEGFARVRAGKVDVFVGAAEWPEEIDRERAERALGRATKRLAAETQEWLASRAKSAAERAHNRIKVAGLRSA